MFAAAIARSWELLGLRGGGPLDLLALRLGNPGRQPTAQPPARSHPQADGRTVSGLPPETVNASAQNGWKGRQSAARGLAADRVA
jgi:hypothetical protein